MENKNNKIDEMMNGMTTEEIEAMKNVDDALDNLMVILLKKEFGVEVECNPGGDREKISIDGKIMDMEEFAAWYFAKSIEKIATTISESIMDDKSAESEAPSKEALPSTVEIPYGYLDDEYDEEEIKSYLRHKYGHYLSGKVDTLRYDYDHKKKIVTVSGIVWGRKR